LGNGKNSYYTQGYPTTKLCINSNVSSGEDDSNNDIYQQFKTVNLDEIYAWIEVATEYSRYNENLDNEGEGTTKTALPILFKGNNPFNGEFGGENYQYGYP